MIEQRVETLESILDAVRKERARQDEKWGVQHWPVFDPVLAQREGGCTPERMAEEYGMPTEARAKFNCDTAMKRGEITWAHILVEEVAEVIGCHGQDTKALEKELIQVMAVCAAIIEDINAD